LLKGTNYEAAHGALFSQPVSFPDVITTTGSVAVADPKLRHGPKGQDVQFFRFSEKVMRNKVLKAQLWMYLRGTHYQYGSRHSHEDQADAPAPESPGGGYDGGGGGGSDGGWSGLMVSNYHLNKTHAGYQLNRPLLFNNHISITYA
jgi:hypothetical protein